MINYAKEVITCSNELSSKLLGSVSTILFYLLSDLFEIDSGFELGISIYSSDGYPNI